ncbi:MAG: hypothetical protein CM15mP113_2250 [Pseudomonadota bacterium]|nr:MAG: hypothetical protein CM15mP113_2250 [Pseudomonadota bacterium]
MESVASAPDILTASFLGKLFMALSLITEVFKLRGSIGVFRK